MVSDVGEARVKRVHREKEKASGEMNGKVARSSESVVLIRAMQRSNK